MAQLEKSSYPEALQVLQSFRESAGEIPYYSGLLGYTHARLGNRTEAERVLEQLKARFPGPWVPPVEVAGIHNGLGDREQALRWLERGCEQRSAMMPFVIDDPRFRNLYPDPRFKSVLRRMGLGRPPRMRKHLFMTAGVVALIGAWALANVRLEYPPGPPIYAQISNVPPFGEEICHTEE